MLLAHVIPLSKVYRTSVSHDRKVQCALIAARHYGGREAMLVDMLTKFRDATPWKANPPLLWQPHEKGASPLEIKVAPR